MEKLVSKRETMSTPEKKSAQATNGKQTYVLPSEKSFNKSLDPIEVTNPAPDLVCLSHLRWDFVYQRPQHLLSRCALERRVFFVEEPVYGASVPHMEISQRECGVYVVIPHLPHGLGEAEIIALQQALLIDELFMDCNITEYLLWYYTPMALAFTRHLEPLIRIYDCMDELSAFKNAPAMLKQLEAELLECADLVFTGGHSLYEAKRNLHGFMFPFPSSIEAPHFRQARQPLPDPPDQADIPHPRLGFFGVIDERMDLELLAGLADARPSWHVVMIGPVVKIDPADLPRKANIHYLGGKNYRELPSYLAGWDIAMLPFALNESTRFISPTKTPEYLAAGVPVISTSIRDVIRPYGQQGLVKIADTPEEFVAAAKQLLSPGFDRTSWLQKVDETLTDNSWDRTWARMRQLINLVIGARNSKSDSVATSAPSPFMPLNNRTGAPTAISPSAGD